LERAIREKKAPAVITGDIAQADAVIAMRSTYQSRPTKLRDLNRPIATVVVKSNTFSQISGALEELLRGGTVDRDAEAEALDEMATGIEQVLSSGRPVELNPRNARLRRAQQRAAAPRAVPTRRKPEGRGRERRRGAESARADPPDPALDSGELREPPPKRRRLSPKRRRLSLRSAHIGSASSTMSNFDDPVSTALVDIQNTPDERQIAIDKVGVRGIRYPISVLDREKGTQHTIGNFSLTVDLPHHFKGTHMSRFLEVLNEHHGEVSVESLPKILQDLRERLDAKSAHIDVYFPFFMTKQAPVTGKEGVMEFTCGFLATSNGVSDFQLYAQVPVTTLCPCSKEISAYGAHNQRGYVTVRVRTTAMVWLEELIETIEGCASCALYPVLKRPDEKWVTEHAYENPRFVEDMVREVALAFNRDPRITSYDVEVENHESIHAHNAYAYLRKDS